MKYEGVRLINGLGLFTSCLVHLLVIDICHDDPTLSVQTQEAATKKVVRDAKKRKCLLYNKRKGVANRQYNVLSSFVVSDGLELFSPAWRAKVRDCRRKLAATITERGSLALPIGSGWNKHTNVVDDMLHS